MTTTNIILTKGKTLYMFNKTVGVTGSFYSFNSDIEIEINDYSAEQTQLFNLRTKTGNTYISLWGDRYEIE